LTEDVSELKKSIMKLVPREAELKDLMTLNNDTEALSKLSDQLNGVDLKFELEDKVEPIVEEENDPFVSERKIIVSIQDEDLDSD
jgi:hypothetical protein